MQTVSNIKLKPSEGIDELKSKSKKLAKIKGEIKYFKILKKSLDARDKRDIHFVYTVAISDREEKEESYAYERVKGTPSCLVVGAGPCGLFAGLFLARRGFSVTLIDRGESVENRKNSVDRLKSEGVLNLESNIQFGEGGAGAFSDGKLNTQTNSPLIKLALSTFIEYGAPEEIGYDSKPHIGSDKLPFVVKNIREEIKKLGGKVLFNTKLEDLTINNGRVESVVINGEKQSFDEIVLAVGHSARDTFKMLSNRLISMERKDFAVGLRIEHLQEDINEAQYGENYDKSLPVADYKLVSHASSRGVFTFCMCPGGYVVPSASEEGMLVTNGMSNYLRNGKNANSAIIVQVGSGDYGEGLFDGVNFQRELERKAFLSGGGNYSAPVQLLKDYLKNKKSSGYGKVEPTYTPKCTPTDLNPIFSESINSALKLAILDMGKRLKGFDCGDAVLTGVESRTSSPIRILRGEGLSSISASNLYPSGEGAGYAGGIMSAAVDGIRISEFISKKYLK